MKNEILPPQLEGWDPNDPQPSADFDADEYMMAMSNSPMKQDRQPGLKIASTQDSQSMADEYGQMFNSGREGALERAAFVIGGQKKLEELRLEKGWGNPIDKGRSITQGLRGASRSDMDHRSMAPTKKGVTVMPMTEHEQIIRMP